MRVAWVAESLTTGGIGPVCRYTAEGVVRLTGWNATVLSLKQTPADRFDEVTGVRYVALDREASGPLGFLRWLRENPHDIVITNDVPWIEPAFPYFPKETQHIVQIHDSSRRTVDIAVRNQEWINGMVAVSSHITDALRNRLHRSDYCGLLETVHNGAAFPLAPVRPPYSGTMRLLYLGSMDPFKGTHDMVPIMKRLVGMRLPVSLVIAGGYDESLSRRFKKRGLDSLVTWMGRVPHDECYSLAAKSDALLMPSRKEAFGMVTIEAMAMGCIPLAYDIVSGNREIIEHGKSGFLLPLGRYSAWANAIKTLHQATEQRQRLSDSAMLRARTDFSESKMSSRYCAFLKKVRENSQMAPSRRKEGQPLENESNSQPQALYHRVLSPGLRNWVRNEIGACPRLCYWLLKRW
jgi:glycosyltransferase involved in cell wall biosynthesis